MIPYRLLLLLIPLDDPTLALAPPLAAVPDIICFELYVDGITADITIDGVIMDLKLFQCD